MPRKGMTVRTLVAVVVAMAVAAAVGFPLARYLTQRRLNGALVEAAGRGDVIEVRRLLAQGADVNTGRGEMFGSTPLFWAAMHGHTDVAALLIARGADVDAGDGFRRTPPPGLRRSTVVRTWQRC